MRRNEYLSTTIGCEERLWGMVRVWRWERLNSIGAGEVYYDTWGLYLVDVESGSRVSREIGIGRDVDLMK